MEKWLITVVSGAGAVVIGLCAVAGGAASKAKAGDIAAAPRVKTGEALSHAGAAGSAPRIVVAGAVECDSPLLSPVAGTPCLFYRHTCVAKWKEMEKDKSTGKMKEVEKSKDLAAESESAAFGINDGSGRIAVTIKSGADLELTSSPSASHTRDGVTYTDSEEILKAAPSFTVYGTLASGAIGPDDLIVSTKPVEELIAQSATMGTVLFVLGGLLCVGGIGAAGVGVILRRRATRPIPVPA